MKTAQFTFKTAGLVSNDLIGGLIFKILPFDVVH